VKSGIVKLEWTQERAEQFTGGYKGKEIIWGQKHRLHFNKMKKQDAWEEPTKEMNRLVSESKEHGKFIVNTQTGENEDEEKQWNRKDECSTYI
jgi:hypothetical protein